MHHLSNESGKVAMCIYGDISTTGRDGTYVLNFRDGVNFQSPDVINPLLKMTTDFLETHKPRRLVADLSNVSACATTMLAMLTAIRLQMHSTRGAFQLANVAPRIKDALRLVRLHKVFKVFPSIEAALDQSRTL